MCLNRIKGSKKGSESENAKIAGERNVDRIFLKDLRDHAWNVSRLYVWGKWILEE
jgi:hypothetical protein